MLIQLAFEVYDFENTVPSDKPFIRIGEKSIVFNKVFLSMLKASKLELAYDSKTKTIRIKSVDNDEKGIQLDKTKIPAANFLNHFKIEQRGRFEAKYDDKNGCFYIKI